MLGDALSLSTLRLLPDGEEYPNPQEQRFGDKIRLLGYEYDRREIMPGGNLAVTLFWQAMQDLDSDYVVRVRLLDEAGNPWALIDDPPADGAPPTDAWKAGNVYEDTHELEIDPQVPPGTYRVEIALFDVESGRRLSIIAEDGHLLDSRLLLAPLRSGSPAEEVVRPRRLTQISYAIRLTGDI